MPVTQKYYPSNGDQPGRKERSTSNKRKTILSIERKALKFSSKQKIISYWKKIQNLFRMS